MVGKTFVWVQRLLGYVPSAVAHDWHTRHLLIVRLRLYTAAKASRSLTEDLRAACRVEAAITEHPKHQKMKCRWKP